MAGPFATPQFTRRRCARGFTAPALGLALAFALAAPPARAQQAGDPPSPLLARLEALAGHGGGARSFGSQSILSSCWSPAELAAGGPAEKAITRRGADVRLGPPARQRPSLAAPVLPAVMRNSIRRVDTGGEKLVALTFDVCEQNGEKAGYDGAIVDYLRANGVAATFFLGGKWMATHQERAMQIIADPLFEAGNHAWTHGNMRVLTGKDMQDQIDFTQAEYELTVERLLERPCAQAAGAAEAVRIPLRMSAFRYPYGTCSAESLSAVNAAGLAAVQWDVVTGDPAKGTSARAIEATVAGRVKPGSIVVMHANGRGWHTSEALPVLVAALKAKGYRFVTVGTLLAAGRPVAAASCYELKPGDNGRYDRIFGRGTGDRPVKTATRG
ncbi:polysaccharide deacetylase family protein [Jiella sonneratiae]|uniref:Chitooligosaccharide deacetylase n=1 Tax=Jiella sonneratiae TaxID=2816856 RepID=A0ABS3J949_9HYPH|nr:polysaccharide deacetylase family protein [Jiella sonneratiae]MBO0906194.1 polysaccharide deacetylase family protein [Jiella sonneratiae]